MHRYDSVVYTASLEVLAMLSSLMFLAVVASMVPPVTG